jgi:hypothetical protein
MMRMHSSRLLVCSLIVALVMSMFVFTPPVEAHVSGWTAAGWAGLGLGVIYLASRSHARQTATPQTYAHVYIGREQTCVYCVPVASPAYSGCGPAFACNVPSQSQTFQRFARNCY